MLAACRNGNCSVHKIKNKIVIEVVTVNVCKAIIKMTDQIMSDVECKIIKAQIERRAKYRKEFLRLRNDPCKQSKESGFVFDKALQHWLSMKTCQVEYFHANSNTIMKGLAGILPMFIYGYFVYQQRSKFEQNCRCGKLRYRDRMFKLQ